MTTTEERQRSLEAIARAMQPETPEQAGRRGVAEQLAGPVVLISAPPKEQTFPAFMALVYVPVRLHRRRRRK